MATTVTLTIAMAMTAKSFSVRGWRGEVIEVETAVTNLTTPPICRM